MTEKLKVKLGSVQETLLLPLWGRATETKSGKSGFSDEKAVEIINSIDYDFSEIEKNLYSVSRLSWIARCIQIDSIITDFIKKYPQATIVNIGCGLDTTFERIDNGSIKFYDLDLPDTIELRRNFFSDTDRRKMISSSFLDKDWLNLIDADNGLLFISAGVLYYFEEAQIKKFLTDLSGRYTAYDFVFDAASPFGIKMANRNVIKKGGMNSSAFLKWGLKSAGVIEKWDKRIHVVKSLHNLYNMYCAYDIC